MPRSSVLPLALLVALSLVGCDDEPPVGGAPPTPTVATPETAPDTALARRIALGRSAYQRYCALCHGDEGQGYLADNAPALANADFLRAASDEYLRASIAYGRPGTPMSAWSRERGGPMPDSQIDEVVAYLRSLGEPAIELASVRVSGFADNARSVYAAQCAECHGDRGQGVSAPQLANGELQRRASDGFLRLTIERGRTGTPMRGFGETLTSQQIDDLVMFIRAFPTLEGPPPPPPGPPPPDLSRIVIHPDGAQASFELREERFVPGAAVHTALEEGRRMVLLDARATSDWAAAHIPGAAPFPFYDVDRLAEHLPRDGTWIVAYCACPHAASGRVVDQLRERGFANTAVLDEGIGWWQSQGYPTETGQDAQGAGGGHGGGH